MKKIVTVALAIFCLSELTMLPTDAQIAPGVTQSAAKIATINGTVEASDGKPIANATVQIIGPTVAGTTSDSRGAFVFKNVQFGKYLIVVNTPGLGQAVRPNFTIAGDLSMSIRYSQTNASSSLKTIAEVSTSSPGAHINMTSSAVTSVSPSEYAFQGNATWGQLFAQIPGVAVSGYMSGGYNPSSVLANAPQAPVILSMNGALPYESSTTLDGMPLQGISAGLNVYAGGAVDLSNMPLNAFDAADIVRGPGANAPSIVDSIGGSFVLHPPGKVDANHFEFSTSNDPYGGIISNAKYSLHLGRLSATFIYGINDSPGPLGTISVMPAVSLTPATINGHAVQGSTTSQPSFFSGITNCYCSSQNWLLYCCVQESSEWASQSGAVALSYDVSPTITAQVFYAGSISKQSAAGPYYPVEFSPGSASPPYRGGLLPSPSGQATYSLPSLNTSPYTSNQSSSLLEEKVTAFLGGGVLRFAALQNNTFNSSDPGSSFPNGEYRLWGTADLGSKSPGVTTAYDGTLSNLTFPGGYRTINLWSNNRDLLGSYALQVGSNSSAGLSYTTSYYNNPFSETFYSAPGVSTGSFGQSSAASETTDETRFHISTQVSDKLSLGLSWYFAQGSYHLPISGTSEWSDSVFAYNAPRFGAVWEANRDIAVRASAGGGYALPALFNLIGGPIQNEGTYYDQTVQNPNLKPEKEFGFDVGTDVRFKKFTVLSFDIYRTNLYGQFYYSNTASSYNGLPLYLLSYGNIGTSLLEGINLDVHRDVPTGVYWHGTLGFTRGYVVSVPKGFYNGLAYPPPNYTPTPCTNCANQTIVPGANFISAAYSASVPYASASADLGYRWSPGKFIELSSTYYGNNNIYNVPAFVGVDASAGFALTKELSLLATFRNITGMYDESVQVTRNGYVVPAIAGSLPVPPSTAIELPYGPRTLIVTAQFSL